MAGGTIIKRCKSYREDAEQIRWKASKGDMQLHSGKEIAMKGARGGVKFTAKNS